MVHESCIFNQIDHILCKKDELKKRCGLFGQHTPSEKAAFISKSNELNNLSAKFYKTIFAVCFADSEKCKLAKVASPL